VTALGGFSPSIRPAGFAVFGGYRRRNRRYFLGFRCWKVSVHYSPPSPFASTTSGRGVPRSTATLILGDQIVECEAPEQPEIAVLFHDAGIGKCRYGEEGPQGDQ
jgi:hypothetical protein